MVIGVLTLAGGTAAGFLSTKQDHAGFLHTETGRVQSNGFALTSDRDGLDFGHDSLPRVVADALTFRIRTTADDATKPLFIGVARSADVDAYLAGVEHDVVTDIEDSPLNVESRSVDGRSAPSRPDSQSFWLASTSGSGSQELRWHPSDGQWTVVVMNADGSQHVAAHVDFGVRLGWLVPLAIVLVVAGLAFVVAAGAVIAVSRQ